MLLFTSEPECGLPFPSEPFPSESESEWSSCSAELDAGIYTLIHTKKYAKIIKIKNILNERIYGKGVFNNRPQITKHDVCNLCCMVYLVLEWTSERVTCALRKF